MLAESEPQPLATRLLKEKTTCTQYFLLFFAWFWYFGNYSQMEMQNEVKKPVFDALNAWVNEANFVQNDFFGEYCKIFSSF